MRQLREIGDIGSSNYLSGRNISDQSFDPRIGRNDVQKNLSDESYYFRCFQWFVFPFTIQIIQLSVGYNRGRVKFNFVSFDIWILIDIYKGLHIFFKVGAIQSWHEMNRKFEAILPQLVNGLSATFVVMASFVHCQDFIIG